MMLIPKVTRHHCRIRRVSHMEDKKKPAGVAG